MCWHGTWYLGPYATALEEKLKRLDSATELRLVFALYLCVTDCDIRYGATSFTVRVTGVYADISFIK